DWSSDVCSSDLDDIGPLGYTVNAHRRPISSSLLAFGGQKDSPSNTGKKWGGVRADGVGLSLSYDKGEANGVWASLSGDQLTGKTVEDNWRVRWMTRSEERRVGQEW